MDTPNSRIAFSLRISGLTSSLNGALSKASSHFSGAIIGCVGMNCSYWPFMVYLPLYFTAGMGWDISRTGLALLVYTVPFLVMPPIAQWLLLRYQARIVIPSGLFTIGLGFMLMGCS